MGLPAVLRSSHGSVLLCLLVISAGACKPRRTPLIPEEFKDGKYRLLFIPEGGSEADLLVRRRYPGRSRLGDQIHVGLSNGLPVRERFRVNVGIAFREAFVVEAEGVDLRDSEGFRFTVKEVQRKRPLPGGERIRFLIDTDESIVRVRYNDPTYYLILKLTYEHKGTKEVIDIPRINPIEKRLPPRL